MSLLSPTEGARREAGRQAQEAKKKGELGATQAKNKVERAIDRVRTDEELREKMIVGLVSSAVTAAIGALSMLAWRRRDDINNWWEEFRAKATGKTKTVKKRVVGAAAAKASDAAATAGGAPY